MVLLGHYKLDNSFPSTARMPLTSPPIFIIIVVIFYYYIVGCKHRASEVLLYIGGRGLVSQIIEPVTFARCAFIIALRNIALDGYLDTRRNI